jgi:hypothetical protein
MSTASGGESNSIPNHVLLLLWVNITYCVYSMSILNRDVIQEAEFMNVQFR